MELQLTPFGQLRCIDDGSDTSNLFEVFAKDWREGLFHIAAQKQRSLSPTLRFWMNYATTYLTSLCHQPDEYGEWLIELPTYEERLALCDAAPPMVGGEYLTPAALASVWSRLDTWAYQTSQRYPKLSSFLAEWAPQWHQVGRVCFHLAENKNNQEKPFAFLATYTTGLGASGKLKHVPLGRALQETADQQDKARLLNLLTPVVRASENNEWVKELVDSSELYKPRAWDTAAAYRFLLSVPDLEQSGLMVRLPDWWKKRQQPKVEVTIGTHKQTHMSTDAMLDFDVSVALGGESLTAAELAALLEGDDGLILFKGQWVEVDQELLQEAIEHWEAIQEDVNQGEISFIEGMRLLAGAGSNLDAEDWDEEAQSWVQIQAGPALKELLEQLRSPEQLKKLRVPKGLKATLRHYQEQGVAWLHLLTELGLGACLADDMGLGKTMQVLSLLLHLKSKRKKRPPSLLVVPASLLGNWKQEAETFAPSLTLAMLHPAHTKKRTLEDFAKDPAKKLKGVDLAVTTYSMLSRQEWLTETEWQLVILDEAQAIKNPRTAQTKAAKRLKSHARIALTGTPIENRLGDLWSLFDFLNPGLLGTSGVFKEFIKRLEQRNTNPFAPLRKLISPYILRRLKTDPTIISDLPEKTETRRYCQLSKAQVRLYQKVVDTMAELLEADTTAGVQRRGLILSSLMKLKQICNHPSQMLGDERYAAKDSGKFVQISNICEEIVARQEKVLIFTQFREIIEPLEEHLAAIFGRPGLILHGSTSVKQRSANVEAFQSPDGPPFFLLSLKAGGTGLNLTAANHVIHFDRWWNPAVENQATDRAFRIGQKRNVLVHKFVTSGTIEERIDAMLQEKQQLADDLLEAEKEIPLTELSDEQLMELVSLDVTRATF